MNFIVPELITHRVVESESIEVKTKWHNFDIKVKAGSPRRVKEIFDDMTKLFSNQDGTLPAEVEEATGAVKSQVKITPRGA